MQPRFRSLWNHWHISSEALAEARVKGTGCAELPTNTTPTTGIDSIQYYSYLLFVLFALCPCQTILGEVGGLHTPSPLFFTDSVD